MQNFNHRRKHRIRKRKFRKHFFKELLFIFLTDCGIPNTNELTYVIYDLLFLVFSYFSQKLGSRVLKIAVIVKNTETTLGKFFFLKR